LLYAKIRNENIEYLRYIVLLKALLLDRTKANSVTEFNETVDQLMSLEQLKPKKKRRTAEEAQDLIKDFEKQFPKIKEQKLKNFKRAD